MTIARAAYHKYSTDELMEAIDVFNVSPKALTQIRAIVDAEEKVPDAGNFFRYYNDRSKTVQFEKDFAAQMGVQHVLAVNSGTSALIAALVAAGVGPGDEVIVPAYTFFASVSAIVVAKAIPVITEINESLTLDPAAIERNITPRTKAIMPVHMVGYPCEMDTICALAKKHNLVVIEDTAQACGGSYHGRYLGTWGDLGCISLDAYKVIGSGEGGIVMTDNDWYFTRAASYHDAAACWRPDRYAKERQEGELFCGENYRMSELNAAVAIAQLRKLDGINQRTRANHDLLKQEIRLPKCAKWVKPTDPEGVCGYTLGMLFDSSEQAATAIRAGVGIGGLADGATKGVRDWHVYWNWEHILEQKTVTADGCPFKCPHVKALPKYHADMCPQTKAIMLRLGVLNTTPADSPEWIRQTAQTINTKFAEIF
jgi:8-amino-3,8-dideoxy-alpha-D-manno-octulosonate transaminase